MAALPHRYPMLLVDRVVQIVPDQSITAIKAVSMNEGFFQGHFPGRPIMPGVLIVEALAQAAGVLAVESFGLANSGKLVYFMAIEGAKFRNPVFSLTSNLCRSGPACPNSPERHRSTEKSLPRPISRQ
jgi:3-hydroxyacyl-[acyl-carrier-protein] dehydratase